MWTRPENVLIELDEGHPLFGKLEDPQYDRRVLRDLKELDPLVQSFRTKGWEGGAITVREVQGLPYPVALDGRQRIRAAREVNAGGGCQGEPIRVFVTISELDDRSASLASVRLNHVRLEDDPVEQAEIALRLKLQGFDLEEIRSALGLRSVEALQDRLRLLDACPELQAAVRSKRIGQKAALVLVRKTQNEQRRALAELLPRGKKPINAKQVRASLTGRAGPIDMRKFEAQTLRDPNFIRTAPDCLLAMARWVLGRASRGDKELLLPYCEKIS